MKKIVLSGAVIFVFVLYVIYINNFSDDRHSNIRIITSSPTNTPNATPAAITGKYKNGTYTGSVVDAFYGNVQVQAVITNGQISDVIFLQYPNDRGTSREINGQAMPLLKQEAITAQSANVDGVSGASQTSPAFIQSLQNALDQAVN